MVPMQILIFLFTLYFFVIGFCGMWRKKEVKIKTPRKTFALVVAAHNEHAVIGQLVENLKQLNYPKDMYDIYVIADNCTDNTAEIAEKGQEKLLLCLDKEIPHGTAVEVTRFSERVDSGIIDLDVTIYCEKASHKGIIIGKHGDMLKRISSLARRDIEKFMGAKVYMETWVKVKENWRDDVNFIRARGYDEQ